MILFVAKIKIYNEGSIMKNLQLKEKDDKIPLSALPDIVFLLLIFFLITTTIGAEKGIGLTLPPIDPNHEPVEN
jgi:biopolymer transport protein ExbD